MKNKHLLSPLYSPGCWHSTFKPFTPVESPTKSNAKKHQAGYIMNCSFSQRQKTHLKGENSPTFDAPHLKHFSLFRKLYRPHCNNHRLCIFVTISKKKKRVILWDKFKDNTHSIAKPVFKLLFPVAVMHCDGFPLDHQLVLWNKIKTNKQQLHQNTTRLSQRGKCWDPSATPPNEWEQREQERVARF